MPRGAAMVTVASLADGDVAVYPAQPALADKVVDKRIGPVPRPGEPAPQLGLRRQDGCAHGRGDQVPERGHGVLAGAAAATRVGLSQRASSLEC